MKRVTDALSLTGFVLGMQHTAVILREPRRACPSSIVSEELLASSEDVREDRKAWSDNPSGRVKNFSIFAKP